MSTPPSRPAGRLFLARHGQTRWNAENRRQGRADIPLDDTGRQQALGLAALLAGERIDRILVSPLGRAIETARPLAEARGMPLQIEPDLLEFDYGTYGGSDRTAVKLKLRRDHLYTPVPGGESLADAWMRATRVASRIKPVLATSHLLIVAHQRLNRLLLGAVEGRSLEEAAASNDYRPPTGSVLAITLELSGAELRVAARNLLETA
ncbi:MAG: histidine phosphatase family protein [Vicinamibacterales bacterium]